MFFFSNFIEVFLFRVRKKKLTIRFSSSPPHTQKTPQRIGALTPRSSAAFGEPSSAEERQQERAEEEQLSHRRRSATFSAALGEALESCEGSLAAAGEDEHDFSASRSISSSSSSLSSVPPPAFPPPPPTATATAISSGEVATVALGAHPHRPLVLAGAAGGEVLLFRFGHREALAAYTPLLPGEGAGGDADADLFGSAPAAWHASPSGAVAAGAWGRPQAARFSRCGERLAALGAGGGLALWRLDAAAGRPDPRFGDDARSGTGGMARAEWASRALSRRGGALAWVRLEFFFFVEKIQNKKLTFPLFLSLTFSLHVPLKTKHSKKVCASSSAVIAVAGSDDRASIQLWDRRAPPSSGPAAAAAAGGGPLVTALAPLPGGRGLAAGDEVGRVWAVDLRTLRSGRGCGGFGPVSASVSASSSNGAGDAAAAAAQRHQRQQRAVAAGSSVAMQPAPAPSPSSFHEPRKLWAAAAQGGGVTALEAGVMARPGPYGGALLAAGGRDGAVRLWAPSDGAALQVLLPGGGTGGGGAGGRGGSGGSGSGEGGGSGSGSGSTKVSPSPRGAAPAPSSSSFFSNVFGSGGSGGSVPAASSNSTSSNPSPAGVGGALASLFSAAAAAVSSAAAAAGSSSSRFQPPRAPVTGLALCADGLVASSLDGVVRAWRPAR